MSIIKYGTPKGDWKTSKAGNIYKVKGNLIAICWPISTFDLTYAQIKSATFDEIAALPTSVKCWGWRLKTTGTNGANDGKLLAKGQAPDEATAKLVAAKAMDEASAMDEAA